VRWGVSGGRSMWLLIDSTVHSHVLVVHLYGEFDVATEAHLGHSLADAAQGHPPRMVVDLSGVTFLDCATVRVLARTALLMADRGGSLVVACPDTHVARVLALTRYTTSFPTVGTVDEAVSLAGDSYQRPA